MKKKQKTVAIIKGLESRLETEENLNSLFSKNLRLYPTLHHIVFGEIEQSAKPALKFLKGLSYGDGDIGEKIEKCISGLDGLLKSVLRAKQDEIYFESLRLISEQGGPEQ